ncbi:MAG TPA: beta-L-arabinofuranosidase domain-containing protein [Bryobacteraceae bacterium]|nr:beta-L-arabinofuranosidase domain-containing protein [Bryobacteraceae bacterium]
MRLPIVLVFGVGAALCAAAPANTQKVQPLPLGKVKLLGSDFQSRANKNREYVLSLKNPDLLQNFYYEAALPASDNHGGWEAPHGQLRGHFLGHWLSAAAYIAASTGDPEARVRMDQVVSELARVQKYNGGRWAASIPEKYLFWIAQKKRVWAPHYTVHKTFMGLIDAHNAGGNKEALAVAEGFALWFYEWTRGFTREQMDDILDIETGGMLEVFADLYGITHKPVYLDLMERYTRGRLFNPLVEGKDVLTNKHANTTIPEAHGAARAYEVTGDPKWRRIAEAYWRSAVTDRGYYATGSQTNGEIWSPPFKLSARLSEKTQEHCVVYNMIRLADYLYRWTGDVQYQDYIERNIHNGILAQQHPGTGMVAYFLPLRAGSQKKWGTPTTDFWCCHGSLVQAQSRHDRYIYYTDDAGLVVAQYIPSQASAKLGGADVTITQTTAREADDHRVHLERDPDDRPAHWAIDFKVESANPAEFTLKLRLPFWLSGKAAVTVNGQPQTIESRPSPFVSLRRTWKSDRIRLILPKALTVSPLPDSTDMVAFMDGPVVLAGLTTDEHTMRGDKSRPESILIPDDEREWSTWLPTYRTTGQDRNIRFVPLSAITDERYTVYFPVKP